MADRLYLSLWYPNFRLESLPAALSCVLRQLAMVGSKRVSAASAYPINFSEPPTYQRIYVVDERAAMDSATPGMPHTPPPDADDASIETAVAEATEQLHDDMAYEFEMRWQLWTLETEETGASRLAAADATNDPDAEADLSSDDLDDLDDPDEPPQAALNTPWRLRPHTVRILGFGPQFDVAGYEQNGHLLVDFGLDSPWVLDTPAPSAHPADEQPFAHHMLDKLAQQHIQQNIEKLLAFTLLVEKHCGISSRLLWTESGEPLAEKLIARLQRVN